MGFFPGSAGFQPAKNKEGGQEARAPRGEEKERKRQARCLRPQGGREEEEMGRGITGGDGLKIPPCLSS